MQYTLFGTGVGYNFSDNNRFDRNLIIGASYFENVHFQCSK